MNNNSNNGLRPSKTILHVEDDPMIARAVARALRQRGFEVVQIASLAEAVVAAKTRPWEGAIVDLNLGLESGAEVALYLKRTIPDLRICFYTGEIDESTLKRAREIAPLVGKANPIDDVLEVLGLPNA
jgi:ActR/RegA family two-component response regulator